MAMHVIEPGQRLQTLAGDEIRFVQVVAEAVVPAGYWLCRDESSGQSRVIAQTALTPIPAPPAVAAPTAVEPLAAKPTVAAPVDLEPNGTGPIEQLAPLPVVTADAVINAAA